MPLIVLAAVLLASGVAKLKTPDDLIGWAELGVPRALRRGWLVRLHPWGEIALALALLLLGGGAGEAAALIALALMTGYLVFVARIVRSGSDASCACFGARTRITRATVVRNAWYVALAAVSAGVAWHGPLAGGVIAGLGGTEWGWILGLAVAAATVAVTMWRVPAPAPQSADPDPAEAPAGAEQPGEDIDDELDYVRARTPAVPVMLADGTTRTLRALTMEAPLLTLAVKEGCGSCEIVLEQVSAWRELLPEVSIRLIIRAHPDETSLTELEPLSLHDLDRNVAESIGYRSTPSAVLYGMDGLLAGGPVSGPREVAEFIDDVYESLHGERPAR